MFNKVLITSLFYILLSTVISFGQNGEANNWFFGGDYDPSTDSAAGLNFNGVVSASILSPMKAPEGSASISDQCGNLLFYTNGRTIWNKSHEIMENGDSIWGHLSGVQNSIIVPISNQRYYVFTADGSSNPDKWEGDSAFAYSLVDMKFNGGLGEVIIKNQVLFKRPNESIAAVHHSNGKDVWVASININDGNKLYAYLVQDDSISNPVISDISTQIHSLGHLKFSPNGQWLTYSKWSELFKFDNTTGQASFFANLGVAGYTLGGSTSFSPNSKVLYYAESFGFGTARSIIQYDLSFEDSLTIVQSKDTIYTIGGGRRFTDMQLAIDGRLYLCDGGPSANSDSIGYIEFPNILGPACNVVPEAIDLNGRVHNTRLPDFIESYFDDQNTFMPQSAHFEINDSVVCIEEMIHIDNRTIGIWDSIILYLGDGSAFFDTTSLDHTYGSLGEFQIKIIAYGSCFNDTFQKVINVLPVSEFSFVDSTICQGDSLTLDIAALNPQNQLWSNGSTSISITVQDSGLYYVDAIDSNGCAISDSTIVSLIDIPLTFDLGENQELCDGDSVILNINAQGAESYSWSHDSAFDQILWVSKAGVYVAEANNSCGSSSDSIALDFIDCNSIFIPNGFSISRSSYFSPITNGEYNFQIYNRFGELIYSGNQDDKGWDGTYLSEHVETDVYVYRVLKSENKLPLTGNFLVIN